MMEKVEIKIEDLTHEIKEEPVECYEFETKEELAEIGEHVGSAGSKNESANKKHECTVCGKAFEGLRHLKRHSRTHTGDKPFKCEECGKTFTQHVDLRGHILLHTGKKHFMCEECGKRFTEKSTLHVHQR